MPGNPVVVSFHNSLLRSSDISLLDGPFWLNDNIIGAFFEYCEHVMCKEYVQQVTFISPEVTQLIKCCSQSDISAIVDSLNLQTKEYIFMPINDCSVAQTSPGGSHWSLLMFCRSLKAFHHYDSCNGLNVQHAKLIFNKLKSCIGLSEASTFETKPSPQQANGYDCGLYVISNVETLVRHYLFKEVLNFWDTGDGMNKRHWLKELMCSLQ